jgi:hypothetical protein
MSGYQDISGEDIRLPGYQVKSVLDAPRPPQRHVHGSAVTSVSVPRPVLTVRDFAETGTANRGSSNGSVTGLYAGDPRKVVKCRVVVLLVVSGQLLDYAVLRLADVTSAKSADLRG